MRNENELTVITKSKNLCSYIFKVTQNSPKKYRFSLVSRLENTSLDIISNLYQANEQYMADSDSLKRRTEFQHSALTSLKILGTIAFISREQQCILPKQYEQISKQIAECQRLIGAWINSDRKRVKSRIDEGI